MGKPNAHSVIMRYWIISTMFLHSVTLIAIEMNFIKYALMIVMSNKKPKNSLFLIHR